MFVSVQSRLTLRSSNWLISTHPPAQFYLTRLIQIHGWLSTHLWFTLDYFFSCWWLKLIIFYIPIFALPSTLLTLCFCFSLLIFFRLTSFSLLTYFLFLSNSWFTFEDMDTLVSRRYEENGIIYSFSSYSRLTSVHIFSIVTHSRFLFRFCYVSCLAYPINLFSTSR